MSGVKTLIQSFFLCLLLNVGHVDGTSSSSSNTLKLSALRFYDPPLSDPDGMTMGLLQAAYIDTAQPTNVSNWLPICELSYTAAERACDMLLPATYDMFVAGSTSAAYDIAGVAMCIDLDCDPAVTSLADCDLTVSFDQTMVSYVICLDKPSNRDCWITDSTMPQYCVDPHYYYVQGEVYTYGLLALVVGGLIVVMFGLLFADALRITSQRREESSGKGGETLVGMNKKAPSVLC